MLLQELLESSYDNNIHDQQNNAGIKKLAKMKNIAAFFKDDIDDGGITKQQANKMQQALNKILKDPAAANTLAKNIGADMHQHGDEENPTGWANVKDVMKLLKVS